MSAEPSSTGRDGPRHVALLVDYLIGGGVQRMMLTLAREFVARGHRVDLIVCRMSGDFVDHIPAGVNTFELSTASKWRTRLTALRADPGAFPVMLRPLLLPKRMSEFLLGLPSLVDQLRRHPPDALFAATPFVNLLAIWARKLAGVNTRVVVSERTSVRATLLGGHRWEQRYLAPLLARTYRQADQVVSVSNALADEFAEVVGFPRELITTLYNPVVGPEIERLRREPVDHPWLAPGEPPVILGVGRLNEQKDFPTLVRAFALVRARRPARLVILGNGRHERDDRRQRAALTEVAASAGVTADVELAGFVANPYAWLDKVALFVLTSRFEGFGNVLVEAMACGCPVVSTDCPVGPAEILEQGRWGPLAPVGDEAALARAMEQRLDAPRGSQSLMARAADFSVGAAIDRYELVLLP